jgi:hypothetical protein
MGVTGRPETTGKIALQNQGREMQRELRNLEG